MHLNERAAELSTRLIERFDQLRIRPETNKSGTKVVDCGIQARGGLEAGRLLAEICLAGLGHVNLGPSPSNLWDGPSVDVWTDHPMLACMASQYAGWQISVDGYFAIGSGPMRAAAAREELFDKIGYRESAIRAVGILESGELPTDVVCIDIAAACGVEPEQLTLLVAPTSSQAGTVQVVARSVETAMHKLFELGFDLSSVESGFGTAPLPPVAADDLSGIGRTNDAILYGGQVTLWVRSADDRLKQLVDGIPSCASTDFGAPFAEIFAKHKNDFYAIDPLLFSPAVVTLHNLETGNSFRSGRTRADVLQRSFGR